MPRVSRNENDTDNQTNRVSERERKRTAEIRER